MPQPNPSYGDGLQGVTDLSVYCYNNGATYLCYDGDPGEDAIQKEYTDANDEPLGSDTRTGFSKGTLNLQYDLITDELPTATKLMRPGFIVSFRGRYYVVGAVKPKIVKNEVIKFSVAVTQLQNPFIPALLTVLGQQRKTANASTTLTVTAVGYRANANITWNIESFSNAGNIPSGASITGSGINANFTVSLPNDVRIIATDTVTGETAHLGWGRFTAA